MGLNVFFLGLGYSAEALIRRTPSLEPSGTARSDERVAALRAAGVEAYRLRRDAGRSRARAGA